MTSKRASRAGRTARFCVAFVAAAGILWALWAGSEVRGQASTPQRRPVTRKTEVPPKAPPKGSKTASQGKELTPDSVALETADGVRLSATYYRSRTGAKAAPVLLLHRRDGTQRDWKAFAEQLQALNYAVMTLDFRGYGESRRVNPVVYSKREGAGRRPVTELNPQTFRRQDYLAMLEDVETAKRFLVQRHNGVVRAADSGARGAGGRDVDYQQVAELNISKLTVIGAELGATIGAIWAARDWSWPDLPFGGQQGRDVIALVLISPSWNMPGVGLSLQGPIADLRTKVPIMVLVGGKSKDPGGIKDATRVFDLANAQASEYRPVLREYPTELLGTKMLGLDLGVETDIVEFLRVSVQQKSVPWEKRETPQ